MKLEITKTEAFKLNVILSDMLQESIKKLEILNSINDWKNHPQKLYIADSINLIESISSRISLLQTEDSE